MYPSPINAISRQKVKARMSFFNKMILALSAILALMGCDPTYDLIVRHEATMGLNLTTINGTRLIDNARLVSFSIVNQSDQQIELRSIPISIVSLYGDPILSNVVADIKLRRDDGQVLIGPVQIPAGTSDRFEARLQEPYVLQPGETISVHLEADLTATQHTTIEVSLGAVDGILSDAIFSNDPTGTPPATDVYRRITETINIYM